MDDEVTNDDGAAVMAMFPLGSALLPGMPAVLRLFEQRYLEMLAELIQTEPVQFGIVLIAGGAEVGGGDRRFEIGCIARVVQLMEGEGFIGLVAEGKARFQIVEWLDDDPYPRAEVRAVPDLEWNDALMPLLEEADKIVRRVLARAQQFGGTRWDPEVELSEEPLARAWQLAAIAPLGELDQMELLRSATLGGLLRATIDLTLAAEPLLADPVPDGVIVVDEDPGDDD
jgi:Lon protease-like protein